MHDELANLLYKRYPGIFPEHLRNRQDGAFRGIECGDGWFALIDTLCAEIQFYSDHNPIPQVVATQVKEKFGTLRFYTLGSGDERTRGMVSMAVAMSAHICEVCGLPGGRRGENGSQIRCDVHHVEQAKNNLA